jgi:hypothetical protein
MNGYITFIIPISEFNGIRTTSQAFQLTIYIEIINAKKLIHKRKPPSFDILSIPNKGEFVNGLLNYFGFY